MGLPQKLIATSTEALSASTSLFSAPGLSVPSTLTERISVYPMKRKRDREIQAVAYNNKGCAQEGNGDYKKALQAYNEAIQNESKSK